MSYRDNIQTPGRILEKKVQYFHNNQLQYLDDEKFVSATQGFNSEITDGTICRWMRLELTEDIGLLPTDRVRLYIYATANGTRLSSTTQFMYLKDTKPEYDANKKTYVYYLYDGMIKSMVLYEPVSLNYPVTCQQYFNAVVSGLNWSTTMQLGVTGSMQLDTDIYYDTENNKSLGYTYRDIISDILQANGLLGYYKQSDGTLADAGWLSNGVLYDVLIDDDILKNQNVSIGKKFGPINSLTLSRANGTDILVEKDDNSISQNGTTNITIADNILLNGDNRGDYINALFNRFNGYEWYEYDCETTGIGGLGLMDKIKINTNGEDYYSYAFNNEITVDEAYNEIIYSNIEDTQVGTGYTYTNSEEKTNKTAEVIIDKKIGKVDIRGKTINLTADDIAISSTNFQVDTNGDMTANNGTFNGGTITLNDDGTTAGAKLIVNNSQTNGKATFFSNGFMVNDKTYQDSDNVVINTSLGSVVKQDFMVMRFQQVANGDLVNAKRLDIDAESISFTEGNGAFTQFSKNDIFINGRSLLENEVLFTGTDLMDTTTNRSLSGNVNDQPNGIILVWSAYTSQGAQDYNWHCDFIPKYLVDNSGTPYVCVMASNNFGNIATKGVTIYDGAIKGRIENSETGTSSGTNIKYNNGAYCLRYVIGV